MSDLVVSGLVRKRAELAGRIAHLRAELRALTADLAHVDAVLRLYEPGMAVEDIKPKPVPAPFRVPRGAMSRRILERLRSVGPATALDLTKQEMAARGADEASYSTAKMREARVGPALRALRDRGLIRSVTGPDGLLLWEIV